MLKIRDNLISSKIVKSVDNNIVNIESGSVVFDNKWITYKNVNFNVNQYVSDAVVSPRINFFQNRNYAVMLVVGLSSSGTLTTVEGTQVKYSSNAGVPMPSTINILPLVGIIIIQDGTNNLNAFKDITDKNIVSFSGAGNIKEKNQDGLQGQTGTEIGMTGIIGMTGSLGVTGLQGHTGFKGWTGLPGNRIQGDTGLKGTTGINWTIHFPLLEIIE